MRRITDAAKWLAVSLLPYSLLKTVISNQERIMTTMADILQRLNLINENLGSATDDLKGDIAYLKELVAANGSTPEIDAALSSIEGKVTGLAGLAAETTVPTEQPPAETVDNGSGQGEQPGEGETA